MTKGMAYLTDVSRITLGMYPVALLWKAILREAQNEKKGGT